MGPQEGSEHIWLKQSIQFSVAGQLRTIEIALPIRPGASAEEIERLLRQADASLDQMTQHLNKKVGELLEQQEAQAAPPAGDVPRSGASATAGARPGIGGQHAEGVGWTAPRQGDMSAGPAGPSLDRKQFIAEIAVLGLNPRQAMERLGVRSLDGVNLRQALEQLRRQLLNERPLSTSLPAPEGEEEGGSAGNRPRGGAAPPSGPMTRRPAPELKPSGPPSQGPPVGRARLHPLAEEEEEPNPSEGAALEQRAPLPIPLRDEGKLIALQERARAQARLDKLRRLHGRMNPPSSDNLKAFRNVVEHQLGVEKTAALLEAIWNVSQPEQLSPDQVAECLRWGMNDYFEDEVERLLQLTAGEES